MHHQNVGRAEGAIEPVGIAKASGKFAQPSRASPLPRSGELSKAVMVGVIGSLRVDSDLPVPATERPLVPLLQLFDTKPNNRLARTARSLTATIPSGISDRRGCGSARFGPVPEVG
jgi:hypothetical protein